MPALDLMMFNCSIRRFVVVIVFCRPWRVPCSPYHLLDVPHHSPRILRLYRGGAFSTVMLSGTMSASHAFLACPCQVARTLFRDLLDALCLALWQGEVFGWGAVNHDPETWFD